MSHTHTHKGDWIQPHRQLQTFSSSFSFTDGHLSLLLFPSRTATSPFLSSPYNHIFPHYCPARHHHHRLLPSPFITIIGHLLHHHQPIIHHHRLLPPAFCSLPCFPSPSSPPLSTNNQHHRLCSQPLLSSTTASASPLSQPIQLSSSPSPIVLPVHPCSSSTAPSLPYFSSPPAITSHHPCPLLLPCPAPSPALLPRFTSVQPLITDHHYHLSLPLSSRAIHHHHHQPPLTIITDHHYHLSLPLTSLACHHQLPASAHRSSSQPSPR